MSQTRKRHALIFGSGLAVLIALGAAVWQDQLNADRAAVVAAFLSILAAVAAWEATARASDTADVVAGIERDRWHAELTPDLEITVHRPSPSDRATLTVRLKGPAALDLLDAVTIRIQDDGLDRTPLTAPPPTVEDVAAHIWGPLHFIAGIDGVADPGRITPEFELEPGSYKRFDMRNTQAPFWWDDQGAHHRWRGEVRDQPVRLRIECRRGDNKPWFIHRDVRIQSSWGAT